VIAVGNIASRVLGLAHEPVIASQFGRDVASYTTASSIPTMIYDLLVNGALSAALVLVFASTPRPTSASSGRWPRW